MQRMFEPIAPEAPRKALRWAEYVLLTAGFICMGWVGYSYLETYVFQSYETYTLNEMLKGRQPSVSGYVDSILSGRGDYASTEGEEVTREMTPEPPKSADNGRRGPRAVRPVDGLLGRIDIPRLRISAIVREGVDLKTLKHAVGHVPETALPGQPGNVAIAAHRDTFFRNLRGVKKGDRIQMVTPSGTFEYQVESTKIVWPTNVDVLRPTLQPAITLVTCYPFNYVGSAPKRFIVRARQVVTEAKADAQKGS